MDMQTNIKSCFRNIQKYKTLETIYRKGSISYMSLNGLKDSGWDVKTLKMIRRVGGC